MNLLLKIIAIKEMLSKAAFLHSLFNKYLFKGRLYLDTKVLDSNYQISSMMAEYVLTIDINKTIYTKKSYISWKNFCWLRKKRKSLEIFAPKYMNVKESA